MFKQDDTAFYLMLKKRIRIWAKKEDWGAPPSLRRLLVQRARLTFQIWAVFFPYVAGGDTEASKLGTIRIAWIPSIQNI